MWRGVLLMRRAIVLAALLLPLSDVSQADEVWVFTARTAPPMAGISKADRLWVLGDIDEPFSALRFENPGDANAAKRLAAARIQSPAGQAAIEKVKAIGAATVMAWRYGIDKLPAVLVDREYVVYGESSVSAALARIERHRNEEN